MHARAHTHTHSGYVEVMDNVSLTLVAISQRIYITKYQVVHFKHTIFKCQMVSQ